MLCCAGEGGLTGHEDLVLVLLVGVGKDVGTLERLREETEDVVDDKQSALCVTWACSVRLHTITEARLEKGPRYSIKLSHMVIHSPFSLYPLDTTGGTVQQAWDCAMVDFWRVVVRVIVILGV